MIPLAYVVRDDVVHIQPLLSLAQDSPHSGDYSSTKEEMIEFISLTHWLFKNDSSGICCHLEEVVRGTSHTSSIKQHQRRKDGRGAWLAIMS